MSLKDYKNRTSFEFNSLTPFFKAVLPVGIDIGYGAVKIFSENGRHIFPSLARPMEKDIVTFPNPTNIRYRDANGQLWYVGEMVKQLTGMDDANLDPESVLAMDRINNAEYKVLFEVAMGLSMIQKVVRSGGASQYLIDSRKIQVMTGLPSKFKAAQGNQMYDNLCGHHQFTLQLGDGDEYKFDFELTEEQLGIVSQPYGTLFGYAVDANGNKVADIDTKRILILDIGFFTADAILCAGGMEKADTTWPDCGMAAVYSLTASELNHRGAPITNLALDKYFESGIVSFSRGGKRETIEAEPIFRKYEDEIVAKLMTAVNNRFQSLADVDYLLVSGGTGEAWFEKIKKFANEHWSGVIVDIAQSEKGASSFANVIGYLRCNVFELDRNGEPPAVVPETSRVVG